MSLSVPQNGVKADNEPVIELFVKVRLQFKLFYLLVRLFATPMLFVVIDLFNLCTSKIYFSQTSLLFIF